MMDFDCVFNVIKLWIVEYIQVGQITYHKTDWKNRTFVNSTFHCNVQLKHWSFCNRNITRFGSTFLCVWYWS